VRKFFKLLFPKKDRMSDPFIIDTKRFDIVTICQSVDMQKFPGAPEGIVEGVIMVEMITQLKEHTAFIDITMHDGTKIKEGIIKVLKENYVRVFNRNSFIGCCCFSFRYEAKQEK